MLNHKTFLHDYFTECFAGVCPLSNQFMDHHQAIYKHCVYSIHIKSCAWNIYKWYYSNRSSIMKLVARQRHASMVKPVLTSKIQMIFIECVIKPKVIYWQQSNALLASEKLTTTIVWWEILGGVLIFVIFEADFAVTKTNACTVTRALAPTWKLLRKGVWPNFITII